MAGSGTSPKAQSAMAAASKNRQTMAGAMAPPESINALLKGGGAMPEVLLKLAQTSMGSVIQLQQNAIQRLGRMGKSAKAYQFQDIEGNIARLWTEIYEKEFRQFFHIPQNSKVIYNMWVKALEGHFMTFFQTPEYVDTLTRTVNSLAEYSAARDSALEDLLHMLPVANRRDMDDMSRELYEVKKRLRKLEKNLN